MWRHLRRRRWQFRLITLFGAITVIAIASGAYGIRRQALQAEQRASELIAAKGGWVVRYTDGTRIEFYPSPPARQLTVSCATGLECMYQPTGRSAEFKNEDLALLEDLRSLRFVSFKNTSVTMDAVKRFRATHPDCAAKF
jgi:hypothetical protein